MYCLAWLRNIIYCRHNSIRSLHLGRGMVSSVRMVSFGHNGKLGHSCVRVTRGRPYDSRVSSSAHNCRCMVDGGGAIYDSSMSIIIIIIIIML